MFDSIISILLFVVITVILFFIQKWISKNKKRYTLVLPVICFVFAIYNSIPNFEESFYIQFSLGAFIASIVYFLVLNIPTMTMMVVSKK